MELALKKEKYSSFVPAWHDVHSGEFTADCVVPDTMPDVRELVDAEGMLLLRSKATEAGCVTLSASVNAMVLYSPEEGSTLQSLSVGIPVELRLDSPQIKDDCRTICRMRIRGLDAKMVNSRKIMVRVDVTTEVWCYEECQQEIACGLKQDDLSVHVLQDTVSFVQVSDIREKAFVITDQYPLPSALTSATGILSQRAEVYAEDVKFVSGKVVFRGHVSVNLLVVGEESNQIESARYETDFSQIMEVDVTGEDAMPDVDLLLTGIYFDLPSHDDNSGKIGVEMHMAAQCVCRKKQQAIYIGDLYSNKENLIPEQENHPCITEIQPISMRQTVTGRAEPPVGDCDIICASALVTGITVDGETVKTAITVRLLCCQSNGQFMSVRCRLGAEFTTEISKDTELQNVVVRVVDVFHTASGGAADLRVVLQMDGYRVGKSSLTCVESVAVEEASEVRKNTPSITLVRSDKNEDVWHLAKRYHSSPESIVAANQGNDSGLLLIPKSR